MLSGTKTCANIWQSSGLARDVNRASTDRKATSSISEIIDASTVSVPSRVQLNTMVPCDRRCEWNERSHQGMLISIHSVHMHGL